MSSPVLTANSIVRCPHGGVATLLSANSRVSVGGSPILNVTDPAIVTGCAVVPDQCAKIVWLQGSPRVLAGGVPVVIQESVGLAMTTNEAAGGPPIVAVAGQRVLAG